MAAARRHLSAAAFGADDVAEYVALDGRCCNGERRLQNKRKRRDQSRLQRRFYDEAAPLEAARAAMSPDALTGLEANLRFASKENMVTRVFGRLSAWQNWIFQRPNAVGDKGALKVYGKGEKSQFDLNRV